MEEVDQIKNEEATEAEGMEREVSEVDFEVIEEVGVESSPLCSSRCTSFAMRAFFMIEGRASRRDLIHERRSASTQVTSSLFHFQLELDQQTEDKGG